MQRRYDLRRSDNYLYTGKVSYVCSGSGTLFVYTGFPVMRSTVSWVVYPFVQDEEMSSSESTEFMSSSSSSLSSSSSFDDILSVLVSGVLNPDAVGIYNQNGTFLSRPAYQREDTGYWIWYNPPVWFIGATLGVIPAWQSDFMWSPNPVGIYTNGVGVTGVATVTITDLSSSFSSITESYSSSSSGTDIISGLPRLYVSSYSTTGFTVTYENIPLQVGYIEFSYNAV